MTLSAHLTITGQPPYFMSAVKSWGKVMTLAGVQTKSQPHPTRLNTVSFDLCRGGSRWKDERSDVGDGHGDASQDQWKRLMFGDFIFKQTSKHYLETPLTQCRLWDLAMAKWIWISLPLLNMNQSERRPAERFTWRGFSSSLPPVKARLEGRGCLLHGSRYCNNKLSHVSATPTQHVTFCTHTLPVCSTHPV